SRAAGALRRRRSDKPAPPLVPAVLSPAAAAAAGATGGRRPMNDASKHEELVARARALKPVLASRTAKADELRRVPDETIADFKEAGFFRMLQPSRWGGLEVDPGTFFEVQMTVASACPSSAWVLGVVAVHSWQLALFAPEAQEEVWGKDPATLVSSSYAP